MLIIVGLLAGALFAFVWLREKEPEYQGKRLSQWLGMYEPGTGNSAASDLAARAVREIGTNAVPWLVRWMKYERPWWRVDLVQSLGNKWYQRDRQRARLAARGFAILGPAAGCAIPELGRMTRNGEQPATALAAMSTVSRFAEGAPVLAGVITDRTARLDFRLHALKSLGNGVAEGNISRTNDYTRLAVVEAATWLVDSNSSIREFATNALEQIAPEALTNRIYESPGLNKLDRSVGPGALNFDRRDR